MDGVPKGGRPQAQALVHRAATVAAEANGKGTPVRDSQQPGIKGTVDNEGDEAPVDGLPGVLESLVCGDGPAHGRWDGTGPFAKEEAAGPVGVRLAVLAETAEALVKDDAMACLLDKRGKDWVGQDDAF
jgi:hypothetical protein